VLVLVLERLGLEMPELKRLDLGQSASQPADWERLCFPARWEWIAQRELPN
jgi:hypothetical protein